MTFWKEQNKTYRYVYNFNIICSLAEILRELTSVVLHFYVTASDIKYS